MARSGQRSFFNLRKSHLLNKTHRIQFIFFTKFLSPHRLPGTFLMRKVMSYYNHKGTNGSAAMMFEKCFPGQVKWVSIKAKSDEIKWKSRAKARRGAKKRKRKDTSGAPSSRRCVAASAQRGNHVILTGVLSSMQLLVQAAQQQLSSQQV